MGTNIKLIGLSLITSMMLVGCGGASSDSNTDETSTTNTGYLIDSEVIGAEYHTSSGLSGITDEYGRFNYNTGDTVTFSLGKLTLGSSQPDTNGIITPKLLIVGDETTPTTQEEEQITLLLQTLQSLDSDGDATNGIYISSDVVANLQTLDAEIEFKSIDEKYLIELDNHHDLGLDEDYDGHLDVSQTDAKVHFENSMSEVSNGHKPDDVGKDAEHGDEEAQQHSEFDLSNYPVSVELTQELKDSLAYMGNEERLAYDIYTNLYNYHLTNNQLEIMQLTNIAEKSEKKHFGIVQDLVRRYNLGEGSVTNVSGEIADNTITQEETISDNIRGRYDIPKIQDLYDAIYAIGINDQESALKVGCMVEVTDINDLDEYIGYAQESNATDIKEAFDVLRNGSYNHYWAFDKGLKNLGIENGCYYAGDALLGENKDGIYPKNEHGNEDTNITYENSENAEHKQYGKSK